MFGETLRSTSATNEWCDVIFKNIICPDINGDVSLKTVLNLLISPRLSEGEVFQCKNESLNLDSENTLYVYKNPNIKSSNEDNYEGFKYVKDLSVFLSQKEPVKVYINETKRTSYITGARLTSPVLHVISGLIPRILPWFFKEKPLTEKETLLVKSLSKKESWEFLTLVNDYMSEYDIRSLKIEKYLKDIEKSALKQEAVRLEDSIKNVYSQLKNLMSEYDRKVNDLDNLNIKMEGIQARIAKPGDNKLMKYFQANKTLDIRDTFSNGFRFIVDTYLDNYDCSKYGIVSNNPTSVIFTRGNSPFFADSKKRKVLFDDIFSAMPRLKIRVWAEFDLNLSGSVYVNSYTTHPDEYKDHVPNPHIYYNGCMGSNQSYANEALLDGDVTTAIEACISSAKNVNIMESVSFGPLCNDIFGEKSDRKCIRLPDGSFCSPKEAYEWIINNPREE